MKGSVYFFLEIFRFALPAVSVLAAPLKLEQDKLLELSPTWPQADSKTSCRESSLKGRHEMSLQERLNGLIMSY
jgi:hypothetical protein